MLRLTDVPCHDCIVLQQWARNVLRARGEWWDVPDDSGLGQRPQWDGLSGDPGEYR